MLSFRDTQRNSDTRLTKNRFPIDGVKPAPRGRSKRLERETRTTRAFHALFHNGVQCFTMVSNKSDSIEQVYVVHKLSQFRYTERKRFLVSSTGLTP